MNLLDNLGDRPNVGDRPDDVISSDDLSPTKSIGWTILTMFTPKGGCRDSAAYPLRCLSARG